MQHKPNASWEARWNTDTYTRAIPTFELVLFSIAWSKKKKYCDDKFLQGPLKLLSSTNLHSLLSSHFLGSGILPPPNK